MSGAGRPGRPDGRGGPAARRKGAPPPMWRWVSVFGRAWMNAAVFSETWLAMHQRIWIRRYDQVLPARIPSLARGLALAVRRRPVETERQRGLEPVRIALGHGSPAGRGPGGRAALGTLGGTVHAWNHFPGQPARRYSGLSFCRAFGTNVPSLRISLPSNRISPPPYSGRWMQTMSQWTCDLFPFPQLS
jgi:hypothetical protein